MGAVFWAVPLHAQNEEVPSGSASNQEESSSPYSDIEVFARVLQIIRQEYVDETKTSYRDLVYAALRGMLSELDPHSQFMEPRDFKGMQEETRSEFGGLGITVTIKDGVLTIVSPMEDTPSIKAGLLPGDQILKINGAATDRMTMSDAVEMLRGEPGEKVVLTIARPETKEVKDYELTRAIIRTTSVKDAHILPEDRTGGRKIGYIRITQFSEPTAKELVQALEKLESEGMEALILDLRFNPGGLLNSAVDVSGLFLPPNKLVVYTEGRTSGSRQEFRTSSHGGKKRAYPMAILVNNTSASGSEIVAGALKDLNRALIIGETTFGKGSVQSVIALPDGSAVRLTTQKYYTPGRKLIHEHGIEPHIQVPLTYQQEARLIRYRGLSGSSSKTSISDMLKLDDPQLSRAIDALTGTLIATGPKKDSSS